MVFRGQGLDQVGRHPFEMLGGIVSQLSFAARSDPKLTSAVANRLGEHRDAAVAACPEIATVLGWQSLNLLGPEAFGEARSIEALANFLDTLGTPDKPALVVLDDCQWADELTVKLIVHWLASRGDMAGGGHVLLVASFRSEEVAADHVFRRIRPPLHLRLSLFEPQDIRRLTESMAGPLPDAAVDEIVARSDGCPFMASAVLRGMVESGRSGRGGSREQEQGAGVGLPAPRSPLPAFGAWGRWPWPISARPAAAGGFLTRRIEPAPAGRGRSLGHGPCWGRESNCRWRRSL